jgi:hypothetical protein
MAQKVEKAGSVAGADLRNFDLVINSENSRSTRALQAGPVMEEDLPLYLRIPHEERRAAWEVRLAGGDPIPKSARQDNPQQLIVQQEAHQPSVNEIAIVEPIDAAELRQYAIRLRGVITKSTLDMVTVGDELLAIKARLEHGQFTGWVKEELRISIRTVQEYMSIALGFRKNAAIALFPRSTALMLSSKSAPPEIVEQVIARADHGNVVSDITLKEMFSEDRRQKKNAARDAVKYPTKRQSKPKHSYEVADADQRLLQQQEEKAATLAAARLIIERFSKADVQFLAQILNVSVFYEFERLAKERLVEGGDR